MRLFIAIELSEEIRDALAQIESRLKYTGADVKWVDKDNIHFTLKFLGEVPEEKIEKIKSVLDAVAKETKSFEISLKDIGAFPKIDYPRVIWVGLEKGEKESIELAVKIDEALSKIGFEKETRSFAAHLTIGRVRSPKNKVALKEKMETLNSWTRDEGQSLGRARDRGASKTKNVFLPLTLNPGPLTLVTNISLIKSTLTPKGPVYEQVHEVELHD